jgi:signal transduction histidine kinase
MNTRRGLLLKYVTYFATLVSVALIASSLLDMYFAYLENRQILGQLQQEKARSAALQIERFVQEIEQQVAFSALPRIDMLVASEAERRLEMSKLLRQVPAIADVALLDPSGRELAYVSRIDRDAEGSGKVWANDPVFTTARSGQIQFSHVHFRKETEPYLTIAVAGQSKQVAIVVTEVNLKFVWDVVSRIRIGAAGHAFVVDSDGYLIAHPDISLVLRKTDLSRLAQVQAARAVSDKAARSMLASDGAGAPVLTSYAPIAALEWFVFVEQPEDEALAPLYATLWRTGLLLVGGLVLSLLASVLLARRIVRPIRKLQQGAAEIGAGRLDHRIAVTTGDELETLASEFNRMATQLQESYAGLEAKVDARTRDLAIANQHKSEFLAAMSHELRTPLNAIIGFSDVLKRQMFGVLNPKQSKYVEVIHTSGRHLLSLINDLLDLSKVEAGKMDLDLAPFSVAVAVENALAMVRGRADGKSIAVAVDLDPGLDVAVADERKFRQILLNLLSNAIKFTPEAGSISIAAKRLPDAIEVSVSDSGIGIAPENQDAIFEEFRQIDGSQRPEGTGLGLTLARKLIKRHGGTIRVESTLGHGARFTFTLPQPEKMPCPTN